MLEYISGVVIVSTQLQNHRYRDVHNLCIMISVNMHIMPFEFWKMIESVSL